MECGSNSNAEEVLKTFEVYTPSPLMRNFIDEVQNKYHNLEERVNRNNNLTKEEQKVYNSFQENFAHYKQYYLDKKDLKISIPITIEVGKYMQWICDDALGIVLQFLPVDDELVFQIRLVSKQFFKIIHQEKFFKRWLPRIDPRTQKLKDPYCIKIPDGNIIWRHGWIGFDNEEHSYFMKPIMKHKSRKVSALNPLAFRTLRSLFLLNLYQTGLNSQERKDMNCYYHESRFIRDGVMSYNLMADYEINKKEFIIYLEFYMLHFIKNLHLQKLVLKINVFFNYQLARIFSILFAENHRILKNFDQVNTKHRFMFTSVLSKQEIENIVRTLIRERFGRLDLNDGNHFISHQEYIQQLQNALDTEPDPKRQKLL